VGSIYGLMLTAWGFASAFGPLLIAYLREVSGAYEGALHVTAGVMAVSMLLPIIVHPPGTYLPPPRDWPGEASQL
jgi:MFS transporter, OFA family, oxalate/formate antiporter